STIPALTSSSWNCSISSHACAVGITPASVSLVALPNTMTLMFCPHLYARCASHWDLLSKTDLPSAHSMVERARTKSTPGTGFLKKMAKESISRFVSPEESAVAPQKFKSRRQLLPQPVAGFQFAKNTGRLGGVLTFF